MPFSNSIIRLLFFQFENDVLVSLGLFFFDFINSYTGISTEGLSKIPTSVSKVSAENEPPIFLNNGLEIDIEFDSFPKLTTI